MPSRKTLTEPLPESVVINISGKGWDLLWLHLFWKSDLKFNIDLQSISYNYDFVVREYANWVDVPRGFQDVLTVNGIVYPDVISVNLDKAVTALLPVSSQNLETTFKEGYIQVGETKFEPDSILISGPERLVGNIKQVNTAEKTFQDKDDNFSETIELEYPQNSVISFSQYVVNLSVDIQKIGEKDINNIPITIFRKPANYDIEFKPSTMSISVKGGVDYIKELKPDDFLVSVAFERNWVKGGEYFAQIDLQSPDHIISSELSTNTVTVVVR